MTGKDPSEHYAELTARHGAPAYARVDAPANREEKARLANLSPDQVTATELAGEPITARLTEAPGNGARIGGLKVTTENGWFAARPSGTEDVYKIYAESFLGPEHLARIQSEAREVVSAALAAERASGPVSSPDHRADQAPSATGAPGTMALRPHVTGPVTLGAVAGTWGCEHTPAGPRPCLAGR